MAEQKPESGVDNPPESYTRGQLLAWLFLDSQTWVHRRVDALTLGEDGTTKRAISFDLTVPGGGREIIGSEGRVVVPLALIEKGALRRVSTKDPAGHPMPVLSTAQNVELAAEMLLALVPQPWIAQGARGDLTSTLKGILRAPAAGLGPESDQKREAARSNWSKWKENSLTIPPSHNATTYASTLERLVLGFLDHFLLAVYLKAEFVDKRCVLKFSYDRDISLSGAGNFVAAAQMVIPDVGFAESQHIEVIVPSGIRIETLEVIETADGQPIARAIDLPEGDRSIAHVAFAATDRTAEGLVSVEMTPVAAGIHQFSRLALAIVIAAVSLGFAERYDLLDIVGSSFVIPSQSASILLIGPALFLSWMARSPEHDAVSQLLLPLRRILLYCTGVLLVLAIAAAVPLTREAWDVAWLLAGGGVFAAAASYICYFWNLPRRLENPVDLLSSDEGDQR
ncbi:hypothetical protein [Pseudarthrobacter sp. NPDC057230]|uniref:hypothetical protein n=1 Tax=Pseudarthrobacter sp. NPDC057230 TaxID=3346057 RepID=UPI003640EECB